MRASVVSGGLAFFTVMATKVLGAPDTDPVQARDDPSSNSDAGVFTGSFSMPSPTGFTYLPKYPTLAPELSSLLNQEATLFTLPSSIVSVLQTAAPSGINVADGCVLGGTKLPDWFGKLPKDVQSYLTSYQASVSSWYTAHSAQLASLTSYVAALSSYDASYLGRTTGVMPTASACSVIAVQSTGVVYPSATKTGKKNVAARPTGALAAGLAGVVGVIGAAAVL
ncbi:hypothetical protein GP486_001486 [Trichoglossum hirsutum]|uniref:Uncharacterized protein n=1 Tax=Trichoglossum hirsutum TaxID=265104 RepID=A0A9P8LGY4_9PEZI|nr:hypothetical protein GP486_001486 [Trichoglossum hirsutum]